MPGLELVFRLSFPPVWPLRLLRLVSERFILLGFGNEHSGGIWKEVATDWPLCHTQHANHLHQVIFFSPCGVILKPLAPESMDQLLSANCYDCVSTTA